MDRRNPFRDNIMRENFDKMCAAYDARHRDIVTPDGNRNRGNSWATDFWRGYDGVKLNWDRASKQTGAYPCYKAGEAVRKSEGDNPQFPA